MKIVFLTDEIPPDCEGGAGFSTFLLAKGLKDLSHEVFIISGTKNKNKDLLKTIYKGIEIFYIHSRFNPKFRSFYSVYNPQALSVLKRKLIEIKPDVVHAHNICNTISFAALRLAKKYVQTVFFTARDTMAITYGKYWWYIDYNNLEIQKNFNYKISWLDLLKQAKKSYLPGRSYLIRRYLNKYCSVVFTVSSELKKVFEQNGIKDARTIYNGVRADDYKVITNQEIAEFKRQHHLIDKKIIFCAGRLNGAKGLNQILAAMAIVKKIMPNAVLVIAAKNDLKKTHEKILKQLGIENNFIHLGWLDEDNIKLAYKASDVVVVPSIYLDPFPRINLEAMASKKPVVGTCFGGTPEVVINNQTGYIVNPLNAEMMARKIIDLLKNFQKAKKFGEAGYQRVINEFSLEKQVKITLEYYNK